MSFQQTVNVENEYKDIKKLDDFSLTTNNLKKVMKTLLITNMELRKNIDGGKIRDNKESTIRRKHFNHWMVSTGRWRDNGILMKSSKLEAWLEMSEKNHSGKKGKKITFRELGMLHNGKFAEWKGAPISGKEGGEFWGVTQTMKNFLKSAEFWKWIGFDIQRMLKRATTKRKKV